MSYLESLLPITEELKNAPSIQAFNEQLSAETSGFAQGLFDSATAGSEMGKEFSNTLLNLVDEHVASQPQIDAPSTNFAPITIQRSNAPSPMDLFGGFVDSVDASQKASNEATRKLLAGESNNLHEVKILQAESGVQFKLFVEMSNKLREAFQEIMRMNV